MALQFTSGVYIAVEDAGKQRGVGEIDAAALAESCALIAEVKPTLTDEALTQLTRLMKTVRCHVFPAATQTHCLDRADLSPSRDMPLRSYIVVYSRCN